MPIREKVCNLTMQIVSWAPNSKLILNVGVMWANFCSNSNPKARNWVPNHTLIENMSDQQNMINENVRS